MISDLINTIFHSTVGGFAVLNVLALRRDKMTKGVSITAFIFYALFGFWNVYFFSQLDQGWSARASLIPAIMNTVWVTMTVYYASRS